MMKKQHFWLSALLAAVMLFAPALFGACDTDGGDKNDDKKTDITFTLAQVGGEADKTTTTAVKITFSAAVAGLTAADLSLTGMTLKSGGSLSADADAKVWTVPVTVTAAGNATVKVTKTSVSATAKSVPVFFKESTGGTGEGNHKAFANANGFPDGYTGTVYINNTPPSAMKLVFPNEPEGQKIPGMVSPAFYDVGGEGITFHDSDTQHMGDGSRKDAVDWKMANNGDDKNGPHLVEPIMGMSYLAWTAGGEWVKVTVNVEETGIYDIDLHYSATGKVTLCFDEDDPYTFSMPVSTGGSHRWNKANVIKGMPLQAGKCVMTVKIDEANGMNLSYFEFVKAEA